MSENKIFLLGEINNDGSASNLTLELAGLGKILAEESKSSFRVLFLGSALEKAATEVADKGVSVVAVKNDKLKSYNPDIYLSVLKDIIKNTGDYLFIAGHSSMGQDILPRLAFSLGAGLVTDCVGVFCEDNRDFVFKRYLYGGNAMTTQEIKVTGKMATVRARVGTPLKSVAEKGRIEYLETEIKGSSFLKIDERQTCKGEIELEDAGVVIAGGRGIGSKEGFDSLKELAAILKGAVGASRPPVDACWTDSTGQIGITGKVVAPDIYLAVGISGSSQHLSGMSESGVIVAVNKDPEAFIFKVADYGVVGDWKKVIPAFKVKIKELVKD